VYLGVLYLSQNSYICPIQHKLIGFYNGDESVYCAVRIEPLHTTVYASSLKVKVKQSRYRPGVAQEVKVPRFHDNGIGLVVRLSALCTGRLYPQETHLILISIRG